MLPRDPSPFCSLHPRGAGDQRPVPSFHPSLPLGGHSPPSSSPWGLSGAGDCLSPCSPRGLGTYSASETRICTTLLGYKVPQPPGQGGTSSLDVAATATLQHPLASHALLPNQAQMATPAFRQVKFSATGVR